MIPPGSTIGIVGGGQLGRMLSLAAAQLGYKCHIFDPHERPCAADVAAAFTRAAYNDRAATYDLDRNLTRDLDQVVTRETLVKKAIGPLSIRGTAKRLQGVDS